MKSKSCKVKGFHVPSDLGIERSVHYVSQHLLLLILWLVNKISYDNVSGFNEASHEFKVKASSLTECFTSNIGSIITPFTLGLSITLVHMFGSKELLDLLSRPGLLKHLNEYGRFKTSAEHHVLEQSKLDNEGLNVRIPSNMALYMRGIIMQM